MFESWVAELLASSLGRFIDIHSLDSLKISLWAGQCILKDVRLLPEAFDYLKLPVAIHSGTIGRLCIKIPWGRWTVTGQPLVIELSDLSLCITTRHASEWEEGPALQRDHAAKQAELAHCELAKLTQRMNDSLSPSSDQPLPSPSSQKDPKTSPSSSSSSSWGLGYIIELLTGFILNRLQLSISNLQVQFNLPHDGLIPVGEGGGGGGSTVGLRIKLVSTATASDLRALPASVAEVLKSSVRGLAGARVVRHAIVSGLSVYWRSGSRQGVEDRASSLLNTNDTEVRP